MTLCPTSATDLGIIRDILGAVDCNVQVYSAAGYRALTGAGSPYPAALTALLVIYVALIGYRLLFALGDTRLAEAPTIALKIGAILAFTLNWGVVQAMVFNFTANAPLQIARVVSQPMATSTARGPASSAADPIAGLQRAYDELSATGVEFGKKAGPNALPSRGGEAEATDALWHASAALLASTAGVLAVASVATGILTAVGPIFIALFLFDSTRGFFVGWVRALVAAILAPLLCWVTTSLLLVVLDPWIEALGQQRLAHALNLNTAASASGIVLTFAAAQGVLLLAGVLVASGFRLSRPNAAAERANLPVRGAAASVLAAPPAVTQSALGGRDIKITPGRRANRGRLSVIPRADSHGPAAAAGPSPERGARLGETYRRANMMRDRTRFGAMRRV